MIRTFVIKPKILRILVILANAIVPIFFASTMVRTVLKVSMILEILIILSQRTIVVITII